MTPERQRKIITLCDEAMALSPEERAAFLARACAGDDALRAEVESLLGYEAAAERFLTSPAVPGDLATAEGPSGDSARTETALLEGRAGEAAIEPGRTIGLYRVVRQLGRGGMGEVYLAERADEEFKRRVAIKIVRRGMDTAEILSRFRNERQILASLDHPNIARLLDGGTTEQGVPYFVMEYIEGQPIDEYCNARNLPTAERLALFRTVCSAVHYAHQNLVVHRDLKPSNILVTEDAEGRVPKLLDFGIAKILNHDMFPDLLPDATLRTRTWERPMTPAYASPEQVRGQAITTASDVYSLGVVLYELLTGQRPYQLKGQAPHEIARIVCETEPERPSTAVARTATRDGASSGVHAGEADKLRRQLKGDLDNIVLMALRKEPQRRYASVEQFSEDLRRHLAGLPVVAREDTFRYRAGKFVARNRWAVAAASLLAALALAFLVTAVVQARRIARERDRAQSERDRAEQVSKFLVNLFRVNDPGESKGNQVTARELLDKGAESIAGELPNQPDAQATFMTTMGEAYRSLGLLEKARTLLESALAARRRLLGNEHPDTIDTMHSLGVTLTELGKYDEAETLLREALAARRKRFGPDKAEVADVVNSLGTVLYEKRDYKAAEPLFREAVEIQRKTRGADNSEYAIYLNDLGLVLSDQGRNDEAEPLMREALGLRRRLLGDVHPDLLSSYNNLATLLLKKRDLPGTEENFRQALRMGIRIYGEENPHVGLYYTNLGYALAEQGKTEEAERMMRRGMEIRRKVLPDDNPNIGHSDLLLGRLLVNQKRDREAEPLLREAVALFRQKFAKGNTMLSDAESVLGECLTDLGRYPEAETYLKDSYEIVGPIKGGQTRLGRETRARLVKLYEAWRKPALAAPYRAAQP